jgi:hypothetical protein
MPAVQSDVDRRARRRRRLDNRHRHKVRTCFNRRRFNPLSQPPLPPPELRFENLPPIAEGPGSQPARLPLLKQPPPMLMLGFIDPPLSSCHARLLVEKGNLAYNLHDGARTRLNRTLTKQQYYVDGGSNGLVGQIGAKEGPNSFTGGGLGGIIVDANKQPDGIWSYDNPNIPLNLAKRTLPDVQNKTIKLNFDESLVFKMSFVDYLVKVVNKNQLVLLCT